MSYIKRNHSIITKIKQKTKKDVSNLIFVHKFTFL